MKNGGKLWSYVKLGGKLWSYAKFGGVQREIVELYDQFGGKLWN